MRTLCVVALALGGCIADPKPVVDPDAPDQRVDATLPDQSVDATFPDASLADLGCPDVCTLPVDACDPADPYCAEVCGVPCLDAAYCGPGLVPGCPEGAIYAPDCAADDARCVEVTACAGRHWCKTRCPPWTAQVPACVAGDPFCWLMDDGTACQSAGCYDAAPDDICGDWSAVDGCIDDRPCERRAFCGTVAECQPFDEPCGDGDIICGEGFRQGQCAPDGRECRPSASCVGVRACVECLPDEPCEL